MLTIDNKENYFSKYYLFILKHRILSLRETEFFQRLIRLLTSFFLVISLLVITAIGYHIHSGVPTTSPQSPSVSQTISPQSIQQLNLAYHLSSFTAPQAKKAVFATNDVPIYTLIGAGEIGNGFNNGAAKTAMVIEDVIKKTANVTVMTLGDNADEQGTLQEYNTMYDPTWGTFINNTKPSLGQYDYYALDTQGHPSGYYAYFGARGGDPSKGYYSYNLGNWHIIVLNTSNNCMFVSCAKGSSQELWLQQDLQANKNAPCTLAYWNLPRYSSGTKGGSPLVQAFWDDLYQAKADVVVNGGDKDYERFGLQDPKGVHDLNGLREFVVGTGGEDLLSIPGTNGMAANSEASSDNTLGVLELTLYPGMYSWQFLPTMNGFTDQGSNKCHKSTSQDMQYTIASNPQGNPITTNSYTQPLNLSNNPTHYEGSGVETKPSPTTRSSLQRLEETYGIRPGEDKET